MNKTPFNWGFDLVDRDAKLGVISQRGLSGSLFAQVNHRCRTSVPTAPRGKKSFVPTKSGSRTSPTPQWRRASCKRSWRARKIRAGALTNMRTVKEDLEATGAMPEIFNTDQGGQFTSNGWTERLKKLGIPSCMDCKGRALHYVGSERFRRSLKLGLKSCENAWMLERFPTEFLKSTCFNIRALFTLPRFGKSGLMRHSVRRCLEPNSRPGAVNESWITCSVTGDEFNK